MKPGKSFEEIKRFFDKNKLRLRDRYGVKNTGIFGSIIRGEETQRSDIDILVEFEDGKETFKNYMGLKFFLEDTLKKKVDLVIIETLKPLIKDDILKEAVYV